MHLEEKIKEEVRAALTPEPIVDKNRVLRNRESNKNTVPPVGNT